MALIHQDDLDTVIQIGNTKNEWYGTGFFYASWQGESGLPFLVTNEHIIRHLIKDGEEEIRLKYISCETDTTHFADYNLYDNDGNYAFYFHHDKEIDLAVIPIDFYGMKNEMGIKILGPTISCSIDKMRRKGVSEGDPVFIPGFPMGNLPINSESVIVRNGSIARIKDVFYGKSKSFLLDSFIFPGNSGAPVFSVPYLGNIGGTQRINQTWLLGVVKGYLPYEEEAISSQTGHTRTVFSENSGLALVHPMDYVEEIINIYKKGRKL